MFSFCNCYGTHNIIKIIKIEKMILFILYIYLYICSQYIHFVHSPMQYMWRCASGGLKVNAGVSITLVTSGHWRCNWQLFPRGVWGHAPPAKFEIRTFWASKSVFLMPRKSKQTVVRGPRGGDRPLVTTFIETPVNVFASSLSSTDLSFALEHCVVFLNKTLNSHSASLLWPRCTNGHQQI